MYEPRKRTHAPPKYLFELREIQGGTWLRRIVKESYYPHRPCWRWRVAERNAFIREGQYSDDQQVQLVLVPTCQPLPAIFKSSQRLLFAHHGDADDKSNFDLRRRAYHASTTYARRFYIHVQGRI